MLGIRQNEKCHGKMKNVMENVTNLKEVAGDLVVTFRKPPALEELEKLGLNERQIKAINYVVKRGSITNKEYQELNKTSKWTAMRDQNDLIEKGIFSRRGEGKKKFKYVLVHTAPKLHRKLHQGVND